MVIKTIKNLTFGKASVPLVYLVKDIHFSQNNCCILKALLHNNAFFISKRILELYHLFELLSFYHQILFLLFPNHLFPFPIDFREID